jgi:hypothetical protein
MEISRTSDGLATAEFCLLTGNNVLSTNKTAIHGQEIGWGSLNLFFSAGFLRWSGSRIRSFAGSRGGLGADLLMLDPDVTRQSGGCHQQRHERDEKDNH